MNKIFYAYIIGNLYILLINSLIQIKIFSKSSFRIRLLARDT